MTTAILILAIALDHLLGEPRRWHPLVGFGALASALAKRLNQTSASPLQQCLAGGVALLMLILPLPVLLYTLPESIVTDVLAVGVVYFCIGMRSLTQHVEPIAQALIRSDEPLARFLTSRIVSRDPETMNIEASAIESVLENGSDAVFAPIFWFVVAGAPGILLYRLVNTLDAMWGYKTPQYLYFGKAAARLDDALNFIPARLTGLGYALFSQARSALRCWCQQAHLHASPNGGVVISAGAGGLGVRVGGPTRYHGQWQDKPVFGLGNNPAAADILRALALVQRTLLGCVVVIALLEWSVLLW